MSDDIKVLRELLADEKAGRRDASSIRALESAIKALKGIQAAVALVQSRASTVVGYGHDVHGNIVPITIEAAQPPCGTDGATLAALVTRDLCESEPANPDDPDTLCVKVNYVAEVIQRHAKPAAPVAPATVAVPDLSSEPYRSRALVAMQKVYVGNPRCNLYTMADMLDAALAASQREGGAT